MKIYGKTEHCKFTRCLNMAWDPRYVNLTPKISMSDLYETLSRTMISNNGSHNRTGYTRLQTPAFLIIGRLL